MARRPNKKDVKKLDAIYELIDMGDLDTALSQSTAFVRRQPNLIEAWDQYFEIAFDLKETYLMWQASRQLISLDPSEAIYWENLIGTSMQMSLVSYTHQLFERYQRAIPAELQNDESKRTQEVVADFLDKQIEDGIFPPDVDIKALAMFDEGRCMITHGDTREGRQLLQKAAKRLPGMASPGNNLALSYMVDGNLPKALSIIEQVLESHPEHVFTRCTRAQILERLGQHKEALAILEAVSQAEPENLDYWYNMLETCAYLHQHQLLVEIYKRMEKRYTQDDIDYLPSEINNLVGTAYAFLGKIRQAKKHWRKAARDGLEIAENNLNDHETYDPYYFIHRIWLQRAWIQKLSEALDHKNPAHAINKLIDKLPGFEHGLRMILERGGRPGVELALAIANNYPLPGLVAFAAGQRGTDQERTQAAQMAAEHGLISRNEPFEMWVDGKQTSVNLHAFEITPEPMESEYSLPPDVQPYLEASHEARLEGDFETMLAEAEKGLAILPGAPMLTNHKYTALMGLGRKDEAHALARQLAAEHPDYLFARTVMAELCIEAGEMDEALEWLNPVLSRQKLHISEFRAMAVAFIRYWTTKGEIKGAKHWLDMLKQFDPEFAFDELSEMVDTLDQIKGLIDRK